jgi:cell division septation protein DedD
MSGILLWSVGLLFLLGWIFTLGVLAGRGLIPAGGETLGELKIQIARIQEMLSKEKTSDTEALKDLTKDPDFDFYKTLSTKEETADPGPAPTAKVREKDAQHAKKPEPTLVGPSYVVQVASLDNEQEGTRLAKELTDKGYSAYCYKVYVKGKAYYRVRCGTFHTQQDALAIKERLLKKEGLKGFVVKMD